MAASKAEHSPSFFIRPLVRKDGIRDGGAGSFSVMTYNILTDQAIPSGTYLYCDEEIRYMRHRYLQIKEEIRYYRPSVVCIQELDPEGFEKYIGPMMIDLGFETAVDGARSLGNVHLGEAIFYRPDVFTSEDNKIVCLQSPAGKIIEELVDDATIKTALERRVDHSNQLVMTKLRHIVSKEALYLATTHVIWADLKLVDVQTIQIAMASKSLKTFISETCEAGVHPMYILAGDFNTSPPYPGYHLMMDGRLSREDVHTLRTFPLPDLPSTKNGHSSMVDLLPSVFNVDLKYQSAYKEVTGEEPSVTTMDDVWKLCLDYIWFSNDTLDVAAVVATPPDKEFLDLPGLPSKRFPSDHLMLQAEFRIKGKS